MILTHKGWLILLGVIAAILLGLYIAVPPKSPDDLCKLQGKEGYNQAAKQCFMTLPGNSLLLIPLQR